MKNARRFKIPLRWHGTEQFEQAHANVMALPLEGIRLPVHRVTRVGSSGNKGQYRVETESYYSYRGERVITGTKLELFPVGVDVLIEQNIADITPWVATFKDGVIHYISWARFENWLSTGPTADVFTLCREHETSIRLDRFHVGRGVATCPSCLQVPSAWFPYTIEPYSHPRAVEKLENKIRSKARRRERYPTAYELLLRDVFSDEPDLPPPPPKPEAVKPIILLPGGSRQREQRRESAKRGKSYAEEKADILRKLRGR